VLIIRSDRTDAPFFHAAEDFLMDNTQKPVFMLWRAKKCILLGKNQNAWKQVNLDYIKEREILLVRRSSGGGTVFCDLGNINFSFIENHGTEKVNNYRLFTKPIVDVLNKMGIPAIFSGRNDLTIEGQKFSGNAQYRKKNRLLHHGTLLFSADLKDLAGALKTDPLKYKDRGIESAAKRVTNIASHLAEPMDVLDFRELIYTHMHATDADAMVRDFTEPEVLEIEKIADQKYRDWNWTIGQSPKYDFHREHRFAGGIVEIDLSVQKGLVTDIIFHGDFLSRLDLTDIQLAMVGQRHDPETLLAILKQFPLEEYFYGITEEELLSLLF
jgi:lipoate-protein ligase A